MIRYNAVQEQNAIPPTVLHVSPPFVYTDKGGDSNAALTDLLLATSSANPQGRKTPYFHTAMAPQLWAPREANSWLALPNSRSPKQGCAGEPSLSLMEQKTLWEKPNTKGQAKETFLPCSHMTPGKLLCILIPLLIEARSHSLLPDKILGRRGWRSLKVFSQQTLQNFKVLSALKGEQAASVQCETPNWKRSPRQILTSTQLPTRSRSGDSRGHTAHSIPPTRPNLHRWIFWSTRFTGWVNPKGLACSTQRRYRTEFLSIHEFLS